MRVLLLVPMAIIAMLGCASRAPIPTSTITLPAAMTAQQRDVAVLAGILNTHPPEDYDPRKELSDEDFDALVWRGFVGTARSRSWFPESRDGDTLYASVNARGLYLKVAIDAEPGLLRSRVVESSGLDQGRGKIHKTGIKWLRNLDAHIRREVGRMSVMAR